MVKDIVKDILFLGQPSVAAGKEDLPVVQDLLDTLKAHDDECVGLAANMIGVRKNIIVIKIGYVPLAMINPIITRKSMAYRAEETCLSLTGSRSTTRYKEIEVEYQDINFKRHKQTFNGFTAQIIQHEVDHLHGIII